MVEMSELRSIMQRCSPSSLVIGDEVCAGTETISALSIVGATLCKLLNSQVPFLFATHLHELPNIPDVEKYVNEQKLRVCHLRVACDETTGDLVYDRKLCDGQGPTIYGLEVCKALDMEPSFLDHSHIIRKHLLHMPMELGGSKTTRYNARVIMDKCELCGSSVPKEAHHIRPQQEADANGFIEHFHKNRAFNIVPLCHKCHSRIHESRNVLIDGFVMTSAGKKLVQT